jgi:hypothetical protein
LVTLLFNVLVTASPKELAGDVGSLRGTTQNLAAAVGTAVSGALLVGRLSAAILANIDANPKLPPEFQSQIDLDSINFISNDRLQGLIETTVAPAQVAEAIRVNTEARLRASKLGLLIWQALRCCDFPGRATSGFHSRRGAWPNAGKTLKGSVSEVAIPYCQNNRFDRVKNIDE